MSDLLRVCVLIAAVSAIPLTLSAQSRKKPVKKTAAPQPTATVAATPVPTPSPEPPKKNSGKANARPEKTAPAVSKNYIPVYFYTFDRPGFTYTQISVEHDENGKGQISMKRDGYDELWTDPIQLSAATVEKLKASFEALKFLDSNENYQYENDYSHLGNITIRVKLADRERTARFNWTTNKDAKALMDEYRRITNEFTWRLEMTTARENQQLLTPGLMETLDSYLQRNELSDPPHLLPLLTELSTDERLPLMARNRASRMIERIQKDLKKR